MARGNRITITVTPSRTSQSVTVRTSGYFGSTPVNQTSLDLPNQTLVAASTSDAYWAAILAQVSPLIPTA